MIPNQESFRPAEAAYLVGESRQYIQWAMDAGKLAWIRDYRKRRVILRPELITFVRDFLKKPVCDPPTLQM